LWSATLSSLIPITMFFDWLPLLSLIIQSIISVPLPYFVVLDPSPYVLDQCSILVVFDPLTFVLDQCKSHHSTCNPIKRACLTCYTCHLWQPTCGIQALTTNINVMSSGHWPAIEKWDDPPLSMERPTLEKCNYPPLRNIKYPPLRNISTHPWESKDPPLRFGRPMLGLATSYTSPGCRL
jgi:hypothetical protein